MGQGIMVFVAVLMAPIGEELLCRGVIFHYAKKFAEMENRRAAFWTANIIQALAFGLIHMNFIQGTFAFILGLLAGVLKERYNSLYPAIALHFVFNFTSSFIAGTLFSALPESVPEYLLLGVLGIAITLLGLMIGKDKLLGTTESLK